MSARRTAFAVAGFAVALYYLLKPGRSLATVAQDVQAWGTGTLTLTQEQRSMKALIEARFSSAGYAWAAPAAVANAWAESRLNPLASGDSGHSIGLFQLNDGSSAAGAGMTVAARQDPEQNIARMLQVAAATPDFLASRGGTHADVTRAFAEHLERCLLCGKFGTEQPARVQHLIALYGPETAAAVAA